MRRSATMGAGGWLVRGGGSEWGRGACKRPKAPQQTDDDHQGRGGGGRRTLQCGRSAPLDRIVWLHGTSVERMRCPKLSWGVLMPSCNMHGVARAPKGTPQGGLLTVIWRPDKCTLGAVDNGAAPPPPPARVHYFKDTGDLRDSGRWLGSKRPGPDTYSHSIDGRSHRLQKHLKPPDAVMNKVSAAVMKEHLYDPIRDYLPQYQRKIWAEWQKHGHKQILEVEHRG